MFLRTPKEEEKSHSQALWKGSYLVETSECLCLQEKPSNKNILEVDILKMGHNEEWIE